MCLRDFHQPNQSNKHIYFERNFEIIMCLCVCRRSREEMARRKAEERAKREEEAQRQAEEKKRREEAAKRLEEEKAQREREEAERLQKQVHTTFSLINHSRQINKHSALTVCFSKITCEH